MNKPETLTERRLRRVTEAISVAGFVSIDFFGNKLWDIFPSTAIDLDPRNRKMVIESCEFTDREIEAFYQEKVTAIIREATKLANES